MKLTQVPKVRTSSLSHLIASYAHLYSKLSLLLLDSSFSCKEEKQTHEQILKLRLQLKDPLPGHRVWTGEVKTPWSYGLALLLQPPQHLLLSETLPFMLSAYCVLGHICKTFWYHKPSRCCHWSSLGNYKEPPPPPGGCSWSFNSEELPQSTTSLQKLYKWQIIEAQCCTKTMALP